jgi:hypothetical protein
MRLRLARLVVLVLAGGLLVPMIRAQEPSDAVDLEVETAPVRVDGRTLFTVRGTTSRPAQERAAAIVQRITDAAMDPSVSTASVVIATEPVGLSIRAGSHLLLYVTEADARIEAMTPAVLAEFHRRRIAETIERYRAERKPERVLASAGVAVLATAIAIGAVLLLGWLFRRLDVLLERRYKARIESLSEKLGDAMRVAPMLRAMQGSVRTARVLAFVAITVAWFDVVLGQFPWTRWLSDDISQLILSPLATIALGIAAYIPNLLFLVVLAFVTRFGLRM